MKTHLPFVLKLGTSVVSAESGDLARVRMQALVRQCARLWRKKQKFVLVSSGAIGLGRRVLQLKIKDRTASLDLSLKQASAAVGQSLLMKFYFEQFKSHGVVVAQVLVTSDDFRGVRLRNLTRVLNELFDLGVLPIINENDCVATDEIKQNARSGFGDNDCLSALVAKNIGAKLLILLSDVESVYSDNPQANRKALPIAKIASARDFKKILTPGKSLRGRGGMESKLKAAQIAATSGCSTFICSGFRKNVLQDFFAQMPRGRVDFGTWIEGGG